MNESCELRAAGDTAEDRCWLWLSNTFRLQMMTRVLAMVTVVVVTVMTRRRGRGSLCHSSRHGLAPLSPRGSEKLTKNYLNKIKE